MSQDLRYGRAVDVPSMVGAVRHLGGNSMSDSLAPRVDGELGRVAARIDQSVGLVCGLSSRAHSLVGRLMGEVSGPANDNAKCATSGPGDLGRVYDQLSALESQIVTLALAIERLEQL